MCSDSNELGWAAVRHLPDAALEVGLDAIRQFHASNIGSEVWIGLKLSAHSMNVGAEITGYSVGGGFFTGTLELWPCDERKATFPRAIFGFIDGTGPDSNVLKELFTARLTDDDATVDRLIRIFEDTDSKDRPVSGADGIEW